MCCREQRKEMRYDMKKIVAMLLALALFSFAAGCGDKAGADIDVAALGAELAQADIFDDIVSEMPAELAPRFYSYDGGDVTECVLYQSTMAAAEEVFVAKCADEAAAGRVKAACEQRVADQTAAYESYVPAEVPKLQSAILQVSGCYVIFVVSRDAAAAQKIVDGYLK